MCGCLIILDDAHVRTDQRFHIMLLHPRMYIYILVVSIPDYTRDAGPYYCA